jgi:hypothetical protein
MKLSFRISSVESGLATKLVEDNSVKVAGSQFGVGHVEGAKF